MNKKICCFFFFLVSASFTMIGCGTKEKAQVHIDNPGLKYDVAEIIIEDSKIWRGNDVFENPFVQANISAEISRPDGSVITAEGFYDGDGSGGQDGSIFKVRIFTDQPGEWRWKISSNQPSMSALEGSFSVSEKTPLTFASGPVVVDESTPDRFKFAQGESVFLLGKFLDHDLDWPLRYSHIWFSEKLTDIDRQALLQRHLKLGVNKINLYIANKGDYKRHAVTPWLGTSNSNQKDRFNLKKWHMFDKWNKTLLDNNLIAHWWFLADDSNFRSLSDKELEILARYTMARLSAYRNSMFILSLEWQEAFQSSRVKRLGNVTQTYNPWQRLISVHGVDDVHQFSADFAFPHEPWADYMDLQTGFKDAQVIYDVAMRSRYLAEKPLIVEEFSFGERTPAELQKTWAILATKPAGIGNGAFVEAIQSILKMINYAELIPQPQPQDNVYVLGKERAAYFITSSEPSSVSFSAPVDDMSDWQAYWIDLKTADRSKASDISITDGNVTANFAGRGLYLKHN